MEKFVRYFDDTLDFLKRKTKGFSGNHRADFANLEKPIVHAAKYRHFPERSRWLLDTLQ